LESIVFPDGPTTIGDYAFTDNGLTQVTIPANVISIGANPFSMNSQLTSIQVDGGNPNYEDRGSNAIFDKSSNTLIAGCKNTNIPYGVTRIGDQAFKETTGLTSVTIPDSVTSIGDHAFDSCTGLTSVTIPDNVNSIGEYVFAYCFNLNSVNIPDGITELKNSLFYKCINLTKVVIPNSVTRIERDVFLECTSLDSITIQGTVTYVYSSAFKQCKPQTLIFGDGVNSSTIKTIINDAGMDTSGLEYIVVPDSVLSEVKSMAELTSEIKSKLIKKSDYYAGNKESGVETSGKKKTVKKQETKKQEVKYPDGEEQDEEEQEEHVHDFRWCTVQDVTANQDGIEELRCSCGEVKERDIIPAATYIVKGLCEAVKNAPINGTATFDSGKNWCISDYIIRKLDERKDATTIISFEYNREKYLMTIPAGGDYTELLTDEPYFYGYFGFASYVPGVKIEKVQ